MKFDHSSDSFSKKDLDKIRETMDFAVNDLSFFNTLMQILPSPIFYKDSLGIYRFCNKAFCDYLGFDKEDIIGHTVYDVAPINLANLYHQADLDLIQSAESQVYESQVRYADGTLKDVVFHKTVHLDSNGEPIGLVGVMLDVTSQKNNERQIQRQNKIKDVLIEISHLSSQNLADIDFINLILTKLVESVDSANYGNVFEFNLSDNPFLSIITSIGYEPKSTIGYKFPLTTSYFWNHTKGNLDRPDYISNLSIYFQDSYPTYLTTLDGRKVNSTLFIPISLTESRKIIISLDSVSIGAFSSFDSINAEYIQLQIPIIYQIYSLNKKNLQLSRYDALTGLMNRGYFNIIFEDRLRTAQRNNHKVSLVMFDLDGLKSVNDSFGHQAGDRYLTHFSSFIRNQFRSSDMFARIGSDEFVGVFSTSDPASLKKKTRLLQTLYSELPIKCGDNSFIGHFRFGIATYPDDSDTMQGLITIADIKMSINKDTTTD